MRKTTTALLVTGSAAVAIQTAPSLFSWLWTAAATVWAAITLAGEL